jgi:uncharacterized membrane protein
LLIGPVSWLVYRAIKKYEIPAIIASGIAGSLTNTILVLGMIGVFGLAPWPLIGSIAVANGLPEAGAAAILVLIVVAAWKRISLRKNKGSSL